MSKDYLCVGVLGEDPSATAPGVAIEADDRVGRLECGPTCVVDATTAAPWAVQAIVIDARANQECVRVKVVCDPTPGIPARDVVIDPRVAHREPGYLVVDASSDSISWSGVFRNPRISKQDSAFVPDAAAVSILCSRVALDQHIRKRDSPEVEDSASSLLLGLVDDDASSHDGEIGDLAFIDKGAEVEDAVVPIGVDECLVGTGPGDRRVLEDVEIAALRVVLVGVWPCQLVTTTR